LTAWFTVAGCQPGPLIDSVRLPLINFEPVGEEAPAVLAVQAGTRDEMMIGWFDVAVDAPE
jgi:hypothetical protein